MNAELPMVVQLGFAGSRALYDETEHPTVNRVDFERELERLLVERLSRLPDELGLGGHHFFCGLSQLAVGADTVFTRACQRLGWLQRLLLPQPVEEFLKAGSEKPDFTSAEQETAQELLKSEHLIERRVVSTSPERDTRFHEVNLELARVSDVLVCVLRAGADAKTAGTRDLIESAEERRRPVLEIPLKVGADGKPTWQAAEERWHRREQFRRPEPPHELAGLRATLPKIPSLADYGRKVDAFTSRESKKGRKHFERAAQLIIITHLFATALAATALVMHDLKLASWGSQLLASELVLLLAGFGAHEWLHSSHEIRRWALNRLAAQITSSVLSLSRVPGYLAYLFYLPIPDSLRPLVRTLNVLHLRDARPLPKVGWRKVSDDYIESRLGGEQRGQIAYYEKCRARDTFGYGLARLVFLLFSPAAMIATGCKLLSHHGHSHAQPGADPLMLVLGMAAVILPLLAVAALSLASSLDLEARAETYQDMVVFLVEQRDALVSAKSPQSFEKLALETEARLLGETATWYSRRVFTSVA